MWNIQKLLSFCIKMIFLEIENDIIMTSKWIKINESNEYIPSIEMNEI